MNVFRTTHVTQVFVGHFAGPTDVDGFSEVEFSNLKKFRADVFRSGAGNETIAHDGVFDSAIIARLHKTSDVRKKGIERLVRFLYSFIQDIPFVRHIYFTDAETIESLDNLADVLSVVVRGEGHRTEYVVGVGADAKRELRIAARREAGWLDRRVAAS